MNRQAESGFVAVEQNNSPPRLPSVELERNEVLARVASAATLEDVQQLIAVHRLALLDSEPFDEEHADRMEVRATAFADLAAEVAEMRSTKTTQNRVASARYEESKAKAGTLSGRLADSVVVLPGRFGPPSRTHLVPYGNGAVLVIPPKGSTAADQASMLTDLRAIHGSEPAPRSSGRGWILKAAAD